MTTETLAAPVATSPTTPIVNDFTINVATANGTGSQTSNIALCRAMFRMGIAVTGKNLFPSNIQGLPTWYRLRLSKDGYQAYRHKYEVLVALNQKTIVEDVELVESGGVVFHDDSLKMPEARADLTYYPMPVKALVKESGAPPALRNYIANMVYVGAVCELFGIEFEEVRGALDTHFKGKQKAVDLNMNMIDRAAAWTRENLTKQDPFQIQRVPGGNEGKLLVEGNDAAALGSVYGGVSVAAWYPITPSTSVIDSLNTYLPKLRTDPETGKATYSVIQAEDELSAIGTIIGAGWVGARSMTSTSGPGISLMAEFAGLGYFAEIPTVVWDVQRVGPSTGLPTRTSQGDIFFTHYLGHGDTQQVVLMPHTPAECFEFGHVSFDMAERLQTPVFVLSDLDLGMNLWTCDRFEYPTQPMDRGKVLSKEELSELGASWGRFVDTDGDGIGYRTIPGTEHPLAGYFTRGTGHNKMAVYSERSDDWEENLDRLRRKFETAKKILPQPIALLQDNATVGVISVGSNHPSILEMLDLLKAQGTVCDYQRVRSLPLSAKVGEFIDRFDHVFVVENNYDGQLHRIIQIEYPQYAMRLKSVARCNGLPLDPHWLAAKIQQHLGSS